MLVGGCDCVSRGFVEGGDIIKCQSTHVMMSCV